jgi:hypothetical protein
MVSLFKRLRSRRRNQKFKDLQWNHQKYHRHPAAPAAVPRAISSKPSNSRSKSPSKWPKITAQDQSQATKGLKHGHSPQNQPKSGTIAKKDQVRMPYNPYQNLGQKSNKESTKGL